MNIKSPRDQSPTYLQRQSQAWCKVHKERVRSIIKQKKLCMDAKLIYMGLLTYFHDGNGVLIEPRDRVARSLGFARERLDYCIDKLVKDGGWLELTETGMVFEPVVFKYITGKEHPDDAESGRIQSDLSKYGRISPNSPAQTSAIDKNRVSFSTGESHEPVEKRNDLYPYQDEEEGEKDDGSRRLPSLFPFLKMNEVEGVKAEHPELDWEDLIAKFIAANKTTKPVSRVNLQWFENFVAMYIDRMRNGGGSAGPTTNGAATGKILPQLRCDWSTDSPDKEEPDDQWRIGTRKVSAATINKIRKMPIKPRAEAERWMLGLIGSEFDVKHVIDHYCGDAICEYWEVLVRWEDDNDPTGSVRGCEYETKEEEARRLEGYRIAEEERKKKIEAEEKAKAEAKELARQEAEKRAEEERKRKEEEAKRKQEEQEEERRKRAEQWRMAEAARQEEERKRREDLQRRIEEGKAKRAAFVGPPAPLFNPDAEEIETHWNRKAEEWNNRDPENPWDGWEKEEEEAATV